MNHLLDHLDKLHTFVVIADSGSLQGAARQLRISQPALSLKLKTLEGAVGSVLFTRSKKGVQLTHAGHNLYRFSKRIIDETDLLSLEMKGEQSRIRVGTFDIITRMIARKLCGIERVTDLSFRTERSSLVLLDALDKEEIDIAIVDDPPVIPGFSYMKVARSPYRLFGAKSFIKTLRKLELLETLQEAPLIYLPGGLAYEYVGANKNAPKSLIDSFIEQFGLGRSKRIRVDSFNLLLELTRQGHGLGLMLTGHILEHLQSGALVEMIHKDLPMPYSSMLYIVTKAGQDKSQLANVINDIESVFSEEIASYKKAKASASK